MSQAFSLASTLLFLDFLLLSQTEPMARQFFTSLYTHDFVGTHDFGNLQMSMNALSLLLSPEKKLHC
jgi:hypothetical protein